MPKMFYTTDNLGPASRTANAFTPITSRMLLNATVEPENEVSFLKSGGTLSDASVNITANSNSVATIFDLVINSTVGNQSISVPATTTGLFRDLDSDTVALNDEVNWEITCSSWTTITIGFLFVSFTPTTFNQVFVSKIGQTFCTTAGGKFSMPHAIASQTVETNTKLNMKVAGTLEKLRVYVTTNADTGGSTVKSRIDGADGNMSVSITASTTGEFLDTSNTDSISVDNDLSFAGSTSTTGDVTVNTIQVVLTPTTGGEFMACNATTGVNSFGNITRYGPPNDGQHLTFATESDCAVTVYSGFTVTNLQVYIQTNTGGSASTIDFRIDTGGGPGSSALTISVGAGLTGWFEDTSNSVSVASGDKINYRVVGPTTGSIVQVAVSAKFLAAGDAVTQKISTLTLLGAG